ncbi:MAG: exosome complex protein Rrp42 [archaeon]
MGSILWELRSDKVVSAIKEKKRLDARKFDEYRDVKIQRGISENADGSARVFIGKTEVIAGAKFAIGTPFPDSPDQGSISVGAELLPLASPSFELGPPNDTSIELARVVDRGIRESKCLDFKSLCLVEGEKVWIAFLDIYAINDDGNLLDASALAAITSLVQARLPKIEDGEIVKGEYEGKIKLANTPVLSTFAKIFDSVVLDPILAEEKAMSARFSVATIEDDRISAFQKGLSGSFHANEITEAVETALKQSKGLRKLVLKE